jgi:glycosyltransferase involved in cell wall biosynthesis
MTTNNTNPMCVCFYTQSFYPLIGGNQGQALLLAETLLNLGIKVIVVTHRQNLKLKKEEIYHGIKIYRVNSLAWIKKNVSITNNAISNKSNKFSYVKVFSAKIYYKIMIYSVLLKLYKLKNEYDIIHSHKIVFSDKLIRFAHKLHKPLLIKDATFNGLQQQGEVPEKKRIYTYQNGIFVAVSLMIASNLKKNHVDTKRIFCIPNGIDITDIENKNNKKADKNTLLFVGNFWQGKIKGLDILLKSMTIVVKEHPNVLLSIVGQGNVDEYLPIIDTDRLRQNVKFLGAIKQMKDLYEKNFVYILPSRSEGMSNAVLEAMSYAMPCVVTNVSGILEQIENEKEGLIVPIEDYQALAKAINYMLSNTDQAIVMGKAAQEKIKAKFDIKIIASQYIDVYKKLINKEYSK